MKKFLSMALALVMSLSLCAVFTATKASAGFADEDQLSSRYAVQAADVIRTIEVMDGYSDDTFRPTAGLTRQAAAKIICNMILGPTTARALPTNARPFPDVLPSATGEDNQFAGYISYCAQQGIISGYADGTFRPSDPLSGYAYLKMLLGALGYDAQTEGFVGDNWKVNVAKIALGIGLNKGIEEELDGTTQVTREAAAVYAFNTLQGDMVEYDSKNTLEINGVTVTMGGGKATPQTWNTSNTNADNINRETSDGANARPIVQFAERYFDKLVRRPNVWDDYAYGDFGRPVIRWYWKGAEIGTYAQDVTLTYHGNVSPSDIYNDLDMSTEDWADVWFNGRDAGYVKVAKGNSDDINDQSSSNMTGNNAIMKDKIGDGTIVEVYYNDASNDVRVCVINVWAGKVSSIKDATSSKNERIVLEVGKWDEDDATRGDNRISRPKDMDATGKFDERREYELPEGAEGTYEEDDVVAYIYDEDDNEIKEILYVLSPVEGTLTRRYDDKSIVLDGDTWKYAKNISFDFNGATATQKDETGLSNRSEYIAYVDEDDLVMWVEESEFSDDQYVLVERIYVEDGYNPVQHVLSATLSTPTTNVESVSTAAPRAYLRFTSGSARYVTLNESAAYRSDNDTIDSGFLPGKIVRYTTTSGGDYKLHTVKAGYIVYGGQNAEGVAVDKAVSSNTLRGFVYTDDNGARRNVQADSNTKFIVNDGGTYKTYTGVRNVPDISAVTNGYAYCKDNLAKVVFFTGGTVEGSSNDIIFLAAPSASKLVEDDDFAPHYEYNAVVKNNITTVRVAAYVNAANSGSELYLNGIKTGSDKKGQCILINDAKYDGDDVLKSGSFVEGSRGLTSDRAHGIKRVAGSIEDIKLDTANTELSKTLSDNIRVYYSNLDGEIEEIYVEDIRTDGNDWVYYVQDGGEITYLFIQEVDEDDAPDAPATPTVISDGYLQQTDAAGMEYTLHYLETGSTALPTTNVTDVINWVTTHSAYTSLTYSSFASNVYVFDAGNGITVRIALQADANRDVNGAEIAPAAE